MNMDYQFKTTPFKHQLETFMQSRDLESFAIFWEQGTGKTKEMVDQAAYLFLKGEIDAVLILAPNNVHRNWITDEVPTHCPDEVLKGSAMHFYQSSKAATVWHKRAIERLMGHKDGLVWLAMSYDAFMTKKGKKLAWDLLSKKRVLYIIDEAGRIKTPGAKRTKSVVASSKYARYRRLLTGTPVANGAFDVYSLMKFLKEDFWKKYNLSSFFAFKNKFGIFEKGYNGAQGKEYDILVAYKNLDKLYEILKTTSSRVTKDDVLDLPPKLYSKRYFDLTPEQEAAYIQLREEYMTFVEGDLVTAPLAIVRLLRLQQITCGYVPSDEREVEIIEEDGEVTVKENQRFHLLGDSNPRLELLAEICGDLPHKAIIWAKFTKDIDQIMDMLGSEAVRYDGQVKDAERAEAIARFQGRRPIFEGGTRTGWEEVPVEQQAKYFVANPAAAGEGLTLHAARTVIYYNNSFKLVDRLQSEDRAHRIGQQHPVSYIDIVAPDTVDEHIVRALRNKLNIANQITGDKFKEWL